MDTDFMKSTNEDHTEMMFMQMGKLPDFSATYADMNEIPVVEFSHDMNCNNSTSNVSFSGEPHAAPFMQEANSSGDASQRRNSMAAMREMIFRIAAMQPINIDPEAVKPPKRRNVKISTDPQSVAARHRRERISERIRILQRLVPGGTKMDTASMLDEAIHYVKFLKRQIQSLERVAENRPATAACGVGFPVPTSSGSYFALSGKGYRQSSSSNLQHLT